MKKAAFVYDYDGTLAKGNIQESSFLPDLGIDKADFWKRVKDRTEAEDADEILVYMHLMLEEAKQQGHDITKQFLQDHGKTTELFPGLQEGGWFQRMNKFAASEGIDLSHYIVSSGIKEMLLGSPIAGNFEHIWASKFAYQNEKAVWPAAAINYTTKTQFLFRINKGVINSWDNQGVNAYKPLRERPVPFERMVFFGDGDTDVPTMKMLTYQGGTSIAVYENDARSRDKVHSLISNGRAEFVALADYTENSQMEITAKAIVARMAKDSL